MSPHLTDEDEEAIQTIMEAFNVDRPRAKELWRRFLKTVDDLKEL